METEGRVSLYRQDWNSVDIVSKLEDKVAKDLCVAFDSVQSAVQATLELMGTGVSEIPVVMPVTAGPDVIAAVLRSGAHPILLDIDEEYLQMNPDDLEEVIKYVESNDATPIVLFEKPIGVSLRAQLVALIQDLPTISVYRGYPNPNMSEADFQCAFNILDLTSAVGGGAMVLHAFSEQVKLLKLVRSGVMGLSASLAPERAEEFEKLFDDFHEDQKSYNRVKEKYENSGLDIVLPSKWPQPIWVKVDNARKTVAHLASYGVEAVVALFPLSDLDEVRKRFSEDPDYPVAEKLKNRFICVPTHPGVEDRVDQIVEAIKEIQ